MAGASSSGFFECFSEGEWEREIGRRNPKFSNLRTWSTPWLTRATQACCERLLADPPLEAHALLCAARLAERLPDRKTGEAIAEKIAAALPGAAFYVPMAPSDSYGLTPLHFAPSPDSPLRRFFAQEQIDAHLDDLMAKQQEDGGWPISWEPPGEAARSEWRGRVTLEAVSCLVAYGRIESGSVGPGSGRKRLRDRRNQRDARAIGSRPFQR